MPTPPGMATDSPRYSGATRRAVTHEVQSNGRRSEPAALEKRGNYVSMSIAGPGEALKPAGGAGEVDLTGEFYVGIGVSAHNPDGSRRRRSRMSRSATPAR